MVILKAVQISGFRSIERTEFLLGRLNVLIGANGAGKSNLISFFKLLYEMRHGRLQNFVGNWGADALLFCGGKITKRIEACLRFKDGETGNVIYRVGLTHTATDSLLLEQEGAIPEGLTPEETVEFSGRKMHGSYGEISVNASRGDIGVTPESNLAVAIKDWRDRDAVSQAAARAGEMVVRNVQNWGIFHFQDTSSTAGIRRRCYMQDNQRLRPDGSNLAAILRKLHEGDGAAYRRIRETIQQIAPWFSNFVLEPIKPNETDVMLNWRDRYSDNVFGPHQLPDGALRAMALITLLLQPEKALPSLIVIDEPELGLHPAAIVVVAGLMKAASLHSQIIVATQSVTLLEEFDAADVIVVDRDDGKSTFTRQDPERLKDWLEEYSLGELWQKNVMGGGPF